MTPFKKIQATAAKRTGGDAALKKLLPQAEIGESAEIDER